MVAIVALAIGLGLGFAGGAFSSFAAQPTPADTSVEAGFDRDMQVHHLQGAQLALIVHERSTDPEILSLSTDILLTQQQQAGQLFGWLQVWDLPQAAAEPPMTWMSRAPLTSTDGAHGHGDGTTPMPATMPGLATPEQVAALEASSGEEGDILFLQLMIAHHRGAIEMADALLARSTNPVATRFATAVSTSQQAEIDLMTSLLAARGATP